MDRIRKFIHQMGAFTGECLFWRYNQRGENEMVWTPGDDAEVGTTRHMAKGKTKKIYG